MAFKDILLYLDTYPEASTDAAVDQAVALCAQIGVEVCAVAAHVRIPVSTNRIAEYLLRLTDLAHQEEQRSLTNAEALLERFRRRAADLGIDQTSTVIRAHLYDTTDVLVGMARVRDVCVVPYGQPGDGQRGVAEAVIFGSGRPVIVLQAGAAPATPRALARVALAWDGGRAAARAVAEALPVLRAASEVRVLTVTDDKPAGPAAAADLVRHLARHDITAAVDEIIGDGQPIGEVLGRAALAAKADLLVMGAYGHSRAREFILGGATESLLDRPPLPVLFAH